MSEAQTLLIIIGGVGAILILTIILAIIENRRNKKNNIPTSKERIRALEDEQLNDEGERTVFHAEVIDMACDVRMFGYKQPRTERLFLIKFKSEGGDIYDVRVSEEMYSGFEIGLSGTLTLIDGQIDSFVPDDIGEGYFE